MAIWNATVSLEAVAEDFSTSLGWNTSDTASISAVARLTVTATTTNLHPVMTAAATLEVEAYTWKGLVSGNQGSFTIKCRGQLYVETRTLPFYGVPVGTVNNIEDLPGSAANGAVYNVAGTSANREPIDAIYSTLSSSWIYQPQMSGRNTAKITHINPLIGTNIVMPDFINFGGAAHTPKYWDKTTITDSFSYSIIDIVNPDVQAVDPAGRIVWKWMVEDLAAPPEGGKYSLDAWPEHSGAGPTWRSKSWYRPQVKGTVKFNVKKNKTRKQRSVVFNNSNVDHMWMEIPGGWEQPFTVVMSGIIHSYPTAKFGHYLLDEGGELPVYKAATEGKDYFLNEGKYPPRNGMLFSKRSARMGCDDPFKSGPSIRIKHTEKARPRTFYGVFNGSSSIFGFKDNKTKNRGYGTVEDTYGAHRYFVTGRRTNRISDNRASHMSLWQIMFINDALTIPEIDGLCHELAEKYQYKKYS